MPLCFEYILIVTRSKLHYTASGIITPIGGRPVNRLTASKIFISLFNQLDAQNLFHGKFYFMPLHVSSTCAHHEEVKIALHSLWYHHTYRCDDTRGCVMQFWPPDNKHMCLKHVKAWNKLIVKHKFCASSWLIPGINILRCTVSKTSKYGKRLVAAMCSPSPYTSIADAGYLWTD
jgi:hypothetical protein